MHLPTHHGPAGRTEFKVVTPAQSTPYVVKAHQTFEERSADFFHGSTQIRVPGSYRKAPATAISSLPPTYEIPTVVCPDQSSNDDRIRVSFDSHREGFINQVKSLNLSQDLIVKTSLERENDSERVVMIPGQALAMELPFSLYERMRNYDSANGVWTVIKRVPKYRTSIASLEDLQLMNLPNPPFPILTSFKLSTRSVQVVHGSRLLDFLEASPMLKTVHLELLGSITVDGIPDERVVVLGHAKDFALTVEGSKQWAYEFVVHLSCPSMDLTHKKRAEDTTLDEIFPPEELWRRIVDQCTSEDTPVEEITLEIKTSPTISWALIFLTSGVTAIGLNFQVSAGSKCDVRPSPQNENLMYNRVLYGAIAAIKAHPHLANVKRLSICHGTPEASFTADILDILSALLWLFESLGPLDELTIDSCDPRPYFDQTLTDEMPSGKRVMFPPTRELTIWHPKYIPDENTVHSLVRLAEAQSATKNSFESVVICGGGRSEWNGSELRPWVKSYRYEEPTSPVYKPSRAPPYIRVVHEI